MTEHLARLVIDGDVVDHLRPDLVIVEFVVRRVLEIPDNLTAVGVYRKRRVGVEIITRTVFGIEHWCGLAGAPIHQVGCGVIRPSVPEGAAASLPSLMVICPSFVSGLTRSRDRVQTP